MPSSEAQQLARDLLGKVYVLPETLDHPQVKSECLQLAYIIQAYGLHLGRASSIGRGGGRSSH